MKRPSFPCFGVLAHQRIALIAQGNLATTYEFVGRQEEALRMRQDAYSDV